MKPAILNPYLSVVVPVLNEQDAIDRFWQRVQPVLDRLPSVAWEVVFVDDGSTDSTVEAITSVIASSTCVRLVKLSRNFGKEAALTAGLEHALGQVVVPLDVDLQDPPEVIAQMIDKWREGFDVVLGTRTSRTTDTVGKRVTAGLFYGVFNRMSRTPIIPNVSDFCLLDRRVVDVIARLPERSRFMKGLMTWPGFRTTTVSYTRAARQVGETKFNYWKLWNFALDGLTSFSTVPLRLWTYLGIAVGFSGLSYAAFLILRTILQGVDVPGYASIMVAVLLLGGVQLVSLGVLGEYLGRMFTEVKRRPVYLVDEIVDHTTNARRPERVTW